MKLICISLFTKYVTEGESFTHRNAPEMIEKIEGRQEKLPEKKTNWEGKNL